MLRGLASLLLDLRDLAQRELRSPERLSHPELWRRGFVSARHAQYGLADNDPAEFLSDTVTLSFPGLADRRVAVILANKLAFHEVLSLQFAKYLPALNGLLLDGHYVSLAVGDAPPGEGGLIDLLQKVGAVVVEPISATGGRGVRILRRDDDGLWVNGKPSSAGAVERLERQLDGYLVSEFLEQHCYAAAVFPATPNTVRLAMFRPTQEEPFLAAAVHRFGTVQSGAVDSTSQKGVSSLIDLAKGTLGPAAWVGSDGTRCSAASHPDTGAQVEGVLVPFWEELTRVVRDLSDTFPYLPVVGWDMLITRGGPRIIKGNHFMGPTLIQLHQPLLADPRVRAFFGDHGLLTRPLRTRLKGAIARNPAR